MWLICHSTATYTLLPSTPQTAVQSEPLQCIHGGFRVSECAVELLCEWRFGAPGRRITCPLLIT